MAADGGWAPLTLLGVLLTLTIILLLLHLTIGAGSRDRGEAVHFVCVFSFLLLCQMAVLYSHLVRLSRQRGGCPSPITQVTEVLTRWGRHLSDCFRQPWLLFWQALGKSRVEAQLLESLVARMCLYIALCIILLVFLAFFVIQKNPSNLISLSGIFFMVCLCILLSFHPGKIRWRPVFMGFFIQFCLAVLTLQTKFGYMAFQYVGARVADLMNNGLNGAHFVFGGLVRQDIFAFTVLPVIVFFSSLVAVLHHAGFLRVCIIKPSRFIHKVMGTTGPESVNAVANIFLSMNEAPLLLKPFLQRMTNSELFAIMVNGFSSIAGSVMVVYINLGAPANHLLIACVLSAPAALAIAKIMYPETKAPLSEVDINGAMKMSPYTNIIEAATLGALDAIPLCAGIAANLMAALSMFNLFNNLLVWIGRNLGMHRDLTLEMMFSYFFWPLAYTMGVPACDCGKVAELLGVKTVLSEFVAYRRFGEIIADSKQFEEYRNSSFAPIFLPNGSVVLSNGTTNQTLVHGFFYTRKAVVISTYALCGFANVGSVGVLLGYFVRLLPHKNKDLARMVLRAMIGGIIAACITGCFAGLLYDPLL